MRVLILNDPVNLDLYPLGSPAEVLKLLITSTNRIALRVVENHQEFPHVFAQVPQRL